MSLAEDFAAWMLEDDGVTVPLKWQICDDCRGEGTHVLHGYAFTQADREEMGDEWYDFVEDASRGVYDTPCPECGGSGKIRTVDEDRMGVTMKRMWDDYRNEMYDLERMERMERMMGA